MDAFERRSITVRLRFASIAIATAVTLNLAVAQQGQGVMVEAFGASYLAYPETRGAVTFSNCWGGARVPLIEAWIEAFHGYYPNIRVTNATQDCGTLLQTQVTQIAGGSPPNVMMVQSQQFPFFRENRALLPLNELMARDDVDAGAFYASELDVRKVGEEVFGLPNVTAGAQQLMYYNTRLLDQVGWGADRAIETWQDLLDLAERTQGSGLLAVDHIRFATSQTGFEVFLYANGGRMWDNELTTVEFDGPEGIEAAQFVLDLIQAQVPRYDDLAAAGDRRDVLTAANWGAERYVLTFNGSWLIFQLRQEAPNLEYGISTFPRNAANPASEGRNFVEGGWSFAIPASARDQDAAWEFAKFISLTEYTCDFIVAQQRPSPLRKCNERPELQASTPFWDTIVASLEEAVVVPVTTIHAQIKELVYEMEDEIIYETMTPETAVRTYAARIQALLDEWNATR
jgi:multiple sugar transport system substrate-binding protein